MTLDEKIKELREANRAREEHRRDFGYPETAGAKKLAEVGSDIDEYKKVSAVNTKSAKDLKIDRKRELLRLCKEIEQLCPYDVYANSWLGSLAPARPYGKSIADYVQLLEAAREELKQHPEIGRERTELKRKLKAQSEEYVQGMRDEIHRLREELQPLHSSTLLLGDHRMEPIIQFAKAFVEAAKQDREMGDTGSLKHMKNMDRVARQTECYLAMLEYVEAVEALYPTMHSDPQAVWNHESYVQVLKAASAQFKSNDFKKYPTTASYAREFEIQDRIIQTSDDPEAIKKASEHLKHMALKAIAGGPSDRRVLAKLSGSDGNPDHPHRDSDPKLFTQIKNAYEKDYEHESRKSAQTMKLQNSRRASESEVEETNWSQLPGRLNDLVYAARWAIEAQKLRDIVDKQHGMLADPTISTEPSTYVGEAKPKGRGMPKAEPKVLHQFSNTTLAYLGSFKPEGHSH